MLAYNDGDTPKTLTHQQIGEMSPDKAAAFMQQVFTNATKQFQYAHSDYPVSLTLHDEAEPNLYSHDVLRFLNGESFQELIHNVTGLEGRVAIDSHATCFQSGHFMTIHKDIEAGDPHEIAYVINMTPAWRNDWGGLLMFFDENMELAETFTPTFNAINLYRVPQAHAVSFVAPFAAGKRFSMTGWIQRING